MSENATNPSFPIGTVAVVIWILLCACMLSGCWSREEQTKEVQTEQVKTVTQTVAAPVVIDSPVGQITVQPAKVEQTQTVERRQITEGQSKAESAPVVPPAIQQLAPVAAQGIGGLVPGLGGVLGLALGAWGWISRQRAIGTLGAVVKAVEEFKADSADGHTVEKLEGTLSRKMDASHKRLVKSLKG